MRFYKSENPDFFLMQKAFLIFNRFHEIKEEVLFKRLVENFELLFENIMLPEQKAPYDCLTG